jgi:hypothetical protein
VDWQWFFNNLLDTLLVGGLLGFGALAMGKGIPQSDPVAQTTPISTPADPNGRNKSRDPGNNRRPCFDDSDVAGANQQFPRRATQGIHNHHRIPQFLGGTDDPSNLFPLPATYHQLITNAWRDQFGQRGDPWYNRPDDPQELEDFAKQLEEKYPLKRCQ